MSLQGRLDHVDNLRDFLKRQGMKIETLQMLQSVWAEIAQQTHKADFDETIEVHVGVLHAMLHFALAHSSVIEAEMRAEQG